MMQDQENKQVKLERRSFFKKFGKGAIGAFVLGFLPFNFLKKEIDEKQAVKIKNPQSKMKVAINPMAVKRNR